MNRKRVRIAGWLAVLLCVGLGIFIGACSIFEHQPVVMTPPTIPGATYVGWETCATCHEAEYKYFKLSDHASVSIDVTDKEAAQGQAEACEACHGPGSLHVENPTDKSKILMGSTRQAEACYACHLDVKGQFLLQHHHPVPEGRMFCTDCHDMHGSDVRAAQVTNLLGKDEKCFKCHKEIRGPFVFEHDAMREGCSVCHTVHGSINDKLLVAGQTTTCIRCHWEVQFNQEEAAFGGFKHDTFAIGQGVECVDHHRASHGSNIWRTFNR